jgi:DnaJ-class molecular chaperone
MTQNAILTKWKFVVEFEDDETREISGTIGDAETHEECGGSIEDQVQHHRSCGRTVVNAEAWEVCARCEGEGLIPSGIDGRVICEACGGHLGSISPSIHLKVDQIAGAKSSAVTGASFHTNERFRRPTRRPRLAPCFEDRIARSARCNA